jgi:hypothetical protein
MVSPLSNHHHSLLLFLNGACLEEKPLPYVFLDQSLLLFINGAYLVEKPLPYVQLN